MSSLVTTTPSTINPPTPHDRVLRGAVTGSFAVVLTCTPFDVVKNYWQGSPQLNHQRGSASALSVLNRILASQGVKGLWRGTGVSLSYVLPNSMTYWTLYEKQKELGVPVYLAAAQARTLAQLFFSPLEFLRTKVQACLGESDSRSVWGVVKRVATEEKISSFWRGIGATLLRDVPFSMIYFGLYESLRKQRVLGELQGQQFLQALTLGAACSAVATVCTHPFDVVKTQLQSYERVQGGRVRIYAVSEALKALKLEYGLVGLFRIGLAPRLMKVMPASGIMLATYEAVRFN